MVFLQRNPFALDSMKSKRKLGAFTKALFCINAIGIAFMIYLYHLATDYDGTANRNFGGPAKAALLTALYEKIEGGDPSDLGLVEVYLIEPAEYGFPKTRALPQDLIPKECGLWFGHLASEEGPSLPSWDEVLAHYDADDRLQAIEFYGSRYGGVLSRDPSLKPRMWGRLKRLNGGPIYITARITGEPD
jgi:hypothetical protein